MSIIDTIKHMFDEEVPVKLQKVNQYLRWNIELTEEDNLQKLKNIIYNITSDNFSYCLVPEIGIWLEWKLPVDYDFDALFTQFNRNRFIVNEEHIER
jgi:hypothetical protein